MQDQEKMQEQAEQANNGQTATMESDAQPQAEAGARQAAVPGMEEKLAAAEVKIAEMQDAFLRAKADTENIRRRAQEDIAKAHKFAIESFAEALVPQVREVRLGVPGHLRAVRSRPRRPQGRGRHLRRSRPFRAV